MKSKAHSKKCQETGVLEELEAEEGNRSPTLPSPFSLLPTSPPHLPALPPVSPALPPPCPLLQFSRLLRDKD